MRAKLKASVAYRALIWGMSALAMVSATAAWAKETVLYSFKGGADGAFPVGPVIRGPRGELYATTMAGGSGNGTVIELDPPAVGRKAWTEKVLYRFTGGDGTKPLGGLLRDRTGALYGTLSEGGGGNCSTYKPFVSGSNFSGIDYIHRGWGPDQRVGCGSVFKLTPPAKQGGMWTETILHQFAKSEGRRPAGSLLMDKTGALYGVASEGGPGQCGGFVSSISISYHRSSSKPPQHSSHTTYRYGCGTFFKLTPPAKGSGAWTETTLYAFSGSADGAYPEAVRARSDAGIAPSTSFFVLSSGGGAALNNGTTAAAGTLVLLAPKSGGSTFTSRVLHTFGPSDGPMPIGPLLADKNDNLYAATTSGGGSGHGAVLQFSPAGAGTWAERTIYSFGPNLTKGSYPVGLTDTLGFDGVNVTGSLYGTTAEGGNLSGCQGQGCGVLFRLKLRSAGSTAWSYSVQYIFGSGVDGKTPEARPSIDSSGVIYGTTEGGGTASQGIVYEITP